MTTDNAKPTVITAAEFVAGGYGHKIENNECDVMLHSNGRSVLNIVISSPYMVHALVVQSSAPRWVLIEENTKLSVHWLPVAASSTDADEVARLRAEVARLREALEKIREEAANQGIHAKTATTKNIAIGLGIAARIARAALETGEAGE